jgi:hypothetical protein
MKTRADFQKMTPAEIKSYLDDRVREVFGGVADAPVAPRKRSESEWAVIAKMEGEEVAAKLRAQEGAA